MFEYQKRKLSEEEYKMLIEKLDEPEPRNREERRKQNKARKKVKGER